METVYLNGEDVQFSGDAPANIQALIDIISQHLAQDDCILATCEVDGVEIIHLDPIQYPNDGSTIRMTSQTTGEALAQTIRDTIEATTNLSAQLNDFSSDILRKPWSDTIQQIDVFTTMLTPINQLTDTLHEYAATRKLSWHSTVSNFLQLNEHALSSFIEAAKCNDVATVSDIIYHKISPHIEMIRQSYNNEILNYLQST